MGTEGFLPLWQFTRGDMPVPAFEQWVYAHEADLQAELGAELHFALLEMNYADPHQVWDMRDRLETALRPQLTCECLSLRDTDVVPMGRDGRDARFMSTLEEVALHGGEAWWLWLGRCRKCHQYWLIAQEERIYDDFLIKRCSTAQGDEITAKHIWPAVLLTYESVLKACRELSTPYRFMDWDARSLVWTVHDLCRARPDIEEIEISDLLGIDTEHVRALKAISPD